VGTVLVVDTDPDTRSRVESAITGVGNTVLVVSSLADAFTSVRDGGIDVVVIDSYDPRVGVVELARKLEALPDAPPLVLVSRSPHAPEISARVGAAAFVAKPLDVAELVAAIERLLGELRPVRIVESPVDDDPSAPVRQVR
jgi:CheY-like chemotaxis protein